MRAIVTASPDYSPIALQEIEASLPGGAAIAPLGPGIWLIAAGGRFGDVAACLAGTIFVRHASPVDVEVPVDAGADPATWVRRTLLPPLGARQALPTPMQVQARILPGGPPWPPGPLAEAVRHALADAGTQAGTGPLPWILSVAVGADRAFAGVGRREACLSPWPGGEVRLRRRPDEVSRSARKLEEALGAFGIDVAPGERALDLGAAPGGWTQYLLGRGLRVTAVDTGMLDPRVAGNPRLTYVQGSALQVPPPRGPFRLLCADLNWDPVRAAECSVRHRPEMATGADGVHTVKFFGRDPLPAIAAVRDVLAGPYRVFAVRHLFHNRAEVTVHLRV